MAKKIQRPDRAGDSGARAFNWKKKTAAFTATSPMGLRESYPATAKVFEDMQAEESRHRQMLIDMYRQRFGEHIPLIRRRT